MSLRLFVVHGVKNADPFDAEETHATAYLVHAPGKEAATEQVAPSHATHVDRVESMEEWLRRHDPTVDARIV